MKWVNDKILEERRVNSKGFLVAVFLQYQSITCRNYIPEFTAAAVAMKCWNVEFYGIEVTENPIMAEACEIRFVPTTVIFHGGNEIKRYEGPYTKESLKQRLADLMADTKKKGTA